jgi:hypothetical protein
MNNETRRLDEDPEDEQPTDPVKPDVEALPAQTLPETIILHVISTGEMIVVPIKETIIVGRKDPSQRVQPDLDLTPFRAYQCGVSRSHAVIFVKDNALWVRALSTANGTQVNAIELSVAQEHPLRDGDELRLGALRMKVVYVAAPAASSST